MKHSIFVPVFLLSFVGCKGDPGPTGGVLSGDIVGRVHLIADNETTVYDWSGVTVFVDQQSCVVTSADGLWKVTGVPAGIHVLSFSKQGYATARYSNFQFVGGGVYFFGDWYLYQLPSVTIARVAISGPDASRRYNFTGTLTSKDSLFREIYFCFDKVPIGSTSTVSYLFDDRGYVMPREDSFSTVIDFDLFKAPYQISSGSKLYVRAFASPRGYYPSFIYSTGKYEIYDLQSLLTNLDSLVIQ